MKTLLLPLLLLSLMACALTAEDAADPDPVPVSLENLPKEVQSGIKSKTRGGKIQYLSKVRHDGKVTYEAVIIKMVNKTQNVTKTDKNGKSVTVPTVVQEEESVELKFDDKGKLIKPEAGKNAANPDHPEKK
jgi:hypothetical protein